jgi:hypothetical protein
MKTLFALFAFCLSNFAIASPLQERGIDPTALSQLTLALGIPADEDVIAATQKRWLRNAGHERWEQTELSQQQRKVVLQWASEQGLYTAWKPASKTYDKALILGATTGLMRTRLDYLKQLWDEGVRFDEIVWLLGDRPLDKRVDGMTDRCKTESESAHFIWQEAELPEEMRNLSVIFVEVPMNGLKRPNTQDTIVAWLEAAPEPCKALFVSDQPFCGYQFAVVDASLPEAFHFDVVGQGVDPASHPAAAAITLDSIARWLYSELK